MPGIKAATTTATMTSTGIRFLIMGFSFSQNVVAFVCHCWAAPVHLRWSVPHVARHLSPPFTPPSFRVRQGYVLHAAKVHNVDWVVSCLDTAMISNMLRVAESTFRRLNATALRPAMHAGAQDVNGAKQYPQVPQQEVTASLHPLGKY
jgi:hypothetical protein